MMRGGVRGRLRERRRGGVKMKVGRVRERGEDGSGKGLEKGEGKGERRTWE